MRSQPGAKPWVGDGTAVAPSIGSPLLAASLGRRLPLLVNAPPYPRVHSQTGADAWPQLVEGSAHECSTQGQHVL